MTDFLSILWAIVSFILGLAWSIVWFILRDLLSTLLWLGIAVWVGFALRYRGFAPGSMAMLRYGRQGAVLFWRWLRGHPVYGVAPAATAAAPATKVVTEYKRYIPAGYVSISEQMNVLVISLLILMAYI